MTGWSDPAFERAAQAIQAHAGLSLESTRCADAESGMRRAMVRAGIADIATYAERLASSRELLDPLVTELTVGETYFFREPDHFNFIRDEVLPRVRARRGGQHVVRIWSAGCATGEEAYSLAILMQETGIRGHVLATDISQHALRRARDATYRPWALRSLDDDRRRRWFHPAGEGWRLDARLEQQVTFERHNLARDAYPSLPIGLWDMDLVLCRNVLIYFDRASIARVARGLYETLAEGGWLLTGPSDPPLDGLAPLVPVITKYGVFYRRGEGRQPIALPPVTAPPPVRTGRASDPTRRAPARMADDDDPTAAVSHLRAVANTRGSAEAVRHARQALKRHRFSVDLHFLYAVLLFDLRRLAEAEGALTRVLYLNRSLAMASYLLGLVRRTRGKTAGARRAFRTARDLARSRPPGEALPLADGESTSALAEAAHAQLAMLDMRQHEA